MCVFFIKLIFWFVKFSKNCGNCAIRKQKKFAGFCQKLKKLKIKIYWFQNFDKKFPKLKFYLNLKYFLKIVELLFFLKNFVYQIFPNLTILKK